MMTYTFKGKPLRDVMRDVTVAMNQTIPEEAKKMAVEWFDNSFQNQGFTDSGFQPWKPRKNENRARRLGEKVVLKRKDKANRAILIGDGTLRASIKGYASPGRVTIIAEGLQYAQIHNQGGWAGRRLAARIPKRQYMGKSQMLYQEIDRMISREILKAFR